MRALVMELVEGPTLAERLARSEDHALQLSAVGAEPSGRPIPLEGSTLDREADRRGAQGPLEPRGFWYDIAVASARSAKKQEIHMSRAIAATAVVVTNLFGVNCRTVARVSGSRRPARRARARPDGRTDAAHAGWEAGFVGQLDSVQR